MGAMKPELAGPEHPEGRSNGCAYADSSGHIPIQRMVNVSLQPAGDGPERAPEPLRALHAAAAELGRAADDDVES